MGSRENERWQRGTHVKGLDKWIDYTARTTIPPLVSFVDDIPQNHWKGWNSMRTLAESRDMIKDVI